MPPGLASRHTEKSCKFEFVLKFREWGSNVLVPLHGCDHVMFISPLTRNVQHEMQVFFIPP